MKIYKILHKPTGLFYKPTRGYYKENLSPRGKLYQNKPNIESYLSGCSGGLSYNHPLDKYPHYERRATKIEDWEIVEMEVVGV